MVVASIVNCGIGNLFSLKAALQREGITTEIVSEIDEKETDVVVLPGVGSFGEACRKLPKAAIGEWVEAGKPLLGICLGLQLFFEKSEEGEGEGLAILPGTVRRLPNSVKVPHIGWNRIDIKSGEGLLQGLDDAPWAYFVHSYYPQTKGPWVTAMTEYGVEFCSAAEWKNVWGLQFHPEKSGRAGRAILRNFASMVRK